MGRNSGYVPVQMSFDLMYLHGVNLMYHHVVGVPRSIVLALDVAEFGGLSSEGEIHESAISHESEGRCADDPRQTPGPWRAPGGRRSRPQQAR
jgi:hypothetical protein